MSDKALIIPRRLAISILHEAQIAQPQPIRGWVSARGSAPAAYQHGEPGQGLWARLWSNPVAPAVPTAQELAAGGLHLVVSLNTKGVLEMRAWELQAGQPAERVLKIAE